MNGVIALKWTVTGGLQFKSPFERHCKMPFFTGVDGSCACHVVGKYMYNVMYSKQSADLLSESAYMYDIV